MLCLFFILLFSYLFITYSAVSTTRLQSLTVKKTPKKSSPFGIEGNTAAIRSIPRRLFPNIINQMEIWYEKRKRREREWSSRWKTKDNNNNQQFVQHFNFKKKKKVKISSDIISVTFRETRSRESRVHTRCCGWWIRCWTFKEEISDEKRTKIYLDIEWKKVVYTIW